MAKLPYENQCFTFIDLFAGLGGFHVALEELGGECVFASELNPKLLELYKQNFGMDDFDGQPAKVRGDIHDVPINEIPEHDVLCGGFPCQPFSQAGKRQGLNDPINGNHFEKIMEILNFRKPKHFILENVPNLKGHDGGETWRIIKEHLESLYDVSENVLSPHQYGIPQHRKRIYIVGTLLNKGGLRGHEIVPPSEYKYELLDILETGKEFKFTPVRPETSRQLEVWENFLSNLQSSEIPRFPIWTMEFGADYPFEDTPPIKLSESELYERKGSFGKPIGNVPLEVLPKYARVEDDFPNWKKSYIRRNRAFYKKHSFWLDSWIKNLDEWNLSHQKFEWNAGDEKPTLKDKILQFRPSGIRVKKKTTFPALVLMKTQLPVIWDETNNTYRYITINEARKLQSLDSLKSLPESDTIAFRALGNAVNATVVREIAINLLRE